MKSDAQIMAELESATAGLLFMSESDFPFEIVRWEGLSEITPEHLREQAGRGADAPVVARSLEDFFKVAMAEQDWKGARELADARRYQSLVRLLKANLEEVKAYRVGEIDIHVFIVGRSREGRWLGLSTRVIET